MDLEKASKGVEVYYSYHPQDEKLQKQLEEHLYILKHIKLISFWSSHMLFPGEKRLETINAHINTADIILLLVSPNFLASNYCYENEMKRAIERFKAGEARVIPIILRPVNWRGTPLNDLEPLPEGGKSVTEWKNRDEAFRNISLGIQSTAEIILEKFSVNSNKHRLNYKLQDAQEISVKEYFFDIVLGFAFEDRFYAEKLADSLCTRGVNVCCRTKGIDKEVQLDFWGKNPRTHFLDLDQRPGRYCVLFLSKNYATTFANYEHETALAHALREQGYILPIYLDETDFPGINEDTVFSIKWHEFGVEDISELLARKVREESRIFPQK